MPSRPSPVPSSATSSHITLRPATEEAEAIVLGFGTLLGAILNFIIIAFVLFCVIRAFNKAKDVAEKAKKKEEEEAKAAEPPKPTTEELLTEILEEIKKK